MSLRPINKVLIANRGEIARRIMRTCREMGIHTVAVYSDADRHELFVRDADEAVPIGGLRPGESYLRGEAIVKAARVSGADAVHPGYGFLSENAPFAQACQDAGLVFIGPKPETIALLGSKIEAKERMRMAEVPLLASVRVGKQNPAQLVRELEPLGWPVVIKASAGGGGRGMRIVSQAAELGGLVELARSEAQAAFGDPALFIEPYLSGSRHVEVQIAGDEHGNVAHLFERECSIQRRHQKIIEESPSPALTTESRRALLEAAVRAARSVGYVNAGTVEFLFAPDGKFYFLEVNTRLQVEHPVTECVTGLDLVRLQIEIARGEPLPEAVHDIQSQGHAIEARLYAEDPVEDYRPSAGRLHTFSMECIPGLRVDSAVASGSLVSPYYDPMLAKVIVHAPTREEAARRLAQALARARIHGLRTNRDLLVGVLSHAEFLAGRTDTDFLTRNDVAKLGSPVADAAAERLHAAAAVLFAQAERRRKAEVLPHVPSGWRNNPSQMQSVQLAARGTEIKVEYQFERGGLKIQIDGDPLVQASCELIDSNSIRLRVAGVERTYQVTHVENTFYVDSPLGASEFAELPRFPVPGQQLTAGSLVAPLPGVVHEVRVAPGDSVAAGDILLVLDSMKVFHRITAPHAGQVADVRVATGAQVDQGALLVVIDVGEGKTSGASRA